VVNLSYHIISQLIEFTNLTIKRNNLRIKREKEQEELLKREFPELCFGNTYLTVKSYRERRHRKSVLGCSKCFFILSCLREKYKFKNMKEKRRKRRTRRLEFSEQDLRQMSIYELKGKLYSSLSLERLLFIRKIIAEKIMLEKEILTKEKGKTIFSLHSPFRYKNG